MSCLRLRFAALDFGVTADGEPIFFEINPNGQWAWLQERIGLDIAHMIADALTKDQRLVPAKDTVYGRSSDGPVLAAHSANGEQLRPRVADGDFGI